MNGSYLRTAINFINDPKGRHDVLDFLKAVMLVALTSLVIYVAIK